MSKKKKLQKAKNKPNKEVIISEPKERVWNNKINWILAMVIILPFIYSRKSMEPALSPRFIFESGFLIAYHLYFFGIRGERYFVRLPKLSNYTFWLSVLFPIWSLVCVSSATNLGESIYEVSRNFLNFLFLFTVIHGFVNSKFNALLFCRWIALAALVHSFIGFDENFGWGFTKFPGGASPHGLMANRNLFGSAQSLVLPFVIFLIYKEKGFWRWISIGVAIAVIGSIYIAVTRSAYLTGTLVVLISIIIPFFMERSLRKRSLHLIITSVSALAIIWGLVQYSKLLDSRPKKRKANTEIVAKNKSKKKGKNKKGKVDTSDLGFLKKFGRSGSIKERLVVWQESIGVIKDEPLLGVGPGNWKVDIPKYRIGGIRNDYGKIVRIRPHNIYVQIVTENGFPGAVIYYGVWILTFIMALTVIRQSKDADERLMTVMLIAGFASFAIDGLFSFPLERYEHTALLFLMIGMAIAFYISLFEQDKEQIKWKWSRLFLIPTVGFLSWNIFLGMERHTFEYHMNRAKVFQKRKQNERIVREAEAGKSKWVSLDPNKDPLEIQSAMALKNLKRYDEAMKEVKIALAYSPNSTRILNTKGTIHTEMKEYDKAIQCYLDALVFAPYYEITLKNLALNYLYSEQYEKCLETLEQFPYEGDEYFEKVHRVADYRLKQEQKKTKKEAGD